MSNRIVPLPASQCVICRSIGGQHLRVCRGIALALGEYAELVGGNTLVLVHARLQMPAFELAAIGSGKSTGSKAAYRRSLPVTVINHVLDLRLLSARVFERQSEWTTPRRFRYCVAANAKTNQ